MASTIAVKIIGDATSLERSFRRANKSADGFNRNMKGVDSSSKRGTGALRGIGRVAGIAGGVLGAAGLAGAARAAFTEMAESAKVTAQTNAAIKSTGGAANVTAKQVDALANSLLAKSGIDDETIRSGENMLLTFRNIRNETGRGNNIFDQASRAVLDMNVAMTHGNVTQESLAKGAIMVGKALNDPIKGLGSLRRVGVSFTADEQAKVKALVATGHTMEAQKLIIAELNKEFGGSAAALGGTLPGKINIMRESFRNLGGTLATQLVPTLTRAVDSINKFLSNTKNQQAIINGFKTGLAAVKGIVGALVGAFRLLSGAVGGSKNAIYLLIGAFAAFKAVKMAGAVANVANQFGLLTRKTNGSTAAAKRATGASAGLRAGLIGKLGLAAAAGFAAYKLTGLILKVTGLDKKLRTVGGKAHDLAAKLGVINDPGKQFEGKSTLGTGAEVVSALRRQAARLEAKGLSPRQAASALARTHPNVARHDLEVAAGVGGKQPIVVHTNVHLDGQKVGTSVTEAQRKHKKRNAPQRRGR